MLCNPSRAVKRVTLGENVKIGSFRCLSAAVGGTLTHLDLTRGTGAKFIDFQLMAEQLPNLRGLAVSECMKFCLRFAEAEGVHGIFLYSIFGCL